MFPKIFTIFESILVFLQTSECIVKEKNICHITTAHPRYDVRIFHKECHSLSNEFSKLSLIVADGLGDETRKGVNIIDSGKPSGRKDRFLNSGKNALKKALETKSDIYHIHDPELLRISRKLKKSGAKIIYDSHEDLPRQVLNKPYIPKIFRKLISTVVEFYENKKVSKLSGVIAATPHIRDRFLTINKNTIDVNNYPISTEIIFNDQWENRENAICYIGGIFKTRGIFETLDAINDTDIKLYLAGNFSPSELENECRAHPGWKNVEFLGYIDRNEINELLGKVKLGLVILEATPSYIVSLPIKMFEYMASGLPVIASDFPLWNQIVSDAGCGICVNQTKPEIIKERIISVISDNEFLVNAGKNGRKAIEEKYNWEIETKKLVYFYDSL